MRRKLSFLLTLILICNVYILPIQAAQFSTVQETSVQHYFTKGVEQSNRKRSLKENRKQISSDLLKLMDDTLIPPTQTKQQVLREMRGMKALVTPEEAVSKGLAPTSDNLVYVYINLYPNSDSRVIDALVNKVTNHSVKDNLVVAWVETKNLDFLSSLKEVRSIQTVHPPIVDRGSVTSEGDNLLKANLFRNLSGINGTGIKVGIISNGVDSWTQARDKGDLPSNLVVLRNAVGGDEGTAMAEIIYDLAPGAQLFFHDCGYNTLDFTEGIQSLVDAGCNIIVDDIGWPSQPFFEDGQVALNLKSILASHNVVYISAAGNEAQAHYQGNFRDDGYHYHDFDNNPGITLLPIHIPAGGNIQIALQWKDKFGASNNDYDLYLCDSNGYLLDYSENYQNGHSDPLEEINWTNYYNGDMNAFIDIRKVSGVAKTLELYVNGGSIARYGVATDSIFGHAALPEVISVGAINANSPNQIADYSSQGPVTINYPTPEIRNKPDVCGIAGVSVTGVGGFPSPFYGTSAAAPHIAAIAALIWSQSPSKSAAEIKGLLRNGTVDLGKSGYDYVFGYGREDIFYATPPAAPTSLSVSATDKRILVSWTANGEPDLAGYQVEYKTETATIWSNVAAIKTATSVTMPKLVNGTNYQFRLKAKDSTGNWSAYSSVVTGIPRDKVNPAVPRGLSLYSVNDHQATLSWTTVTALDLAGYTLAYKQAIDTNWIAEVPVGKVKRYIITGLQNDVQYKFAVKALDTSGNLSNYSTSVFGTPVDKMPPAVPSGLKTTIGLNSDITLDWTPNTETDLASYEISWQKSGKSSWQSAVVVSGTNTYLLTGFIPNAKYTFRIRAKDQKLNWSAYSPKITAVPRV